MIIKSPAKINLALDVSGKREDGYHSVETIMQEIRLYDEIELEKADSVTVRTSVPYVPDDERNIAYRAARSFFEKTGIRGGAAIKITKNIPVGAGLGGGSSNAAAVLTCLNRLYGAGLGKAQMEEIGLSLGADVPFFFTGGTCLARGLGEVLTPLGHTLNAWAVLVKPNFGVNTGWAYQRLDSVKIKRRPNIKALAGALEGGDINRTAKYLCNVFEEAVFPLYPQLERIKQALISNGAAGALMSGSGSVVFGIFDSERAAKVCAENTVKRLGRPEFGVYKAEFAAGR